MIVAKRMRPLPNEFLISNTDRNAYMHEDFMNRLFLVTSLHFSWTPDTDGDNSLEKGAKSTSDREIMIGMYHMDKENGDKRKWDFENLHPFSTK